MVGAVDSVAGLDFGLVDKTDAAPGYRLAWLANHPGIVHDDYAAEGVYIVAEVYIVAHVEVCAASVADRRNAVDIGPSCMHQA